MNSYVVFVIGVLVAWSAATAGFAFVHRRAKRRRALDTPPAWTPPDTTDSFAAWEDLFDPQSRRY